MYHDFLLLFSFEVFASLAAIQVNITAGGPTAHENNLGNGAITFAIIFSNISFVLIVHFHAVKYIDCAQFKCYICAHVLHLFLGHSFILTELFILFRRYLQNIHTFCYPLKAMETENTRLYDYVILR